MIKLKEAKIKELENRLDSQKIKCDECKEDFKEVAQFKVHILQKHNFNHKENQIRIERLRDIINELENDAKEYLHNIIEANILETTEEFLPQEWKNLLKDKCYSCSEDKFVCEVCDHRFSSKKALTIHKKRPHTVKCDQCKYSATTASILKSHIMWNHDEDSVEDQ